MTSKEKTVTGAEFARMLGVSRSTVTRAKQAGRLVLDQAGRILVEESLARYHATAGGRTDVAQRHARTRGAELPPPPDGVAAAPQAGKALEMEEGDESGGDEAAGGRQQYKRMVMRYENDTIKLEHALRRHQRYPLDAVKAEAVNLGNTPRAAVERLIDETAPQLAIANPARRRTLLRQAVARVQRILKTERVRALRRLRERR